MGAAAAKSTHQTELETALFSEREARARREAARQDLVLRRSGIQCGQEDTNRYDLLYQRYNQPVGINLKLEDVEVWLGIRVI